MTPTFAGAGLDAPTLAVQFNPVGLTDNMEIATGAGPAIPEPYTDVQAPARRLSRGRCGGQGSQGFYRVQFINPAIRCGLQPELCEAASPKWREPVLGTRSKADWRYWDGVPRRFLEYGGTAPVRRAPGCPLLSLYSPPNKFVAVVAEST